MHVVGYTTESLPVEHTEKSQSNLMVKFSFADDRGSTPTCLVQQCMTWCQAGPVPLLLPVSRRLAQPRLSAVSTLADCTGPVEHLAATRNGQHVFCGLENGQVDMYHLASRKLCHTFPGTFKSSMIWTYNVIYSQQNTGLTSQ